MLAQEEDVDRKYSALGRYLVAILVSFAGVTYLPLLLLAWALRDAGYGRVVREMSIAIPRIGL